MVGYSRLISEDEAGTIRTLTAYREEIAMLERAMQLLPRWETIVGPEEFARTPDYFRTAGLP